MGKSQGNLRKGGQSLVLAENRWLSPTGPQSKEKTETIDSSAEKNRGAQATAGSQGAIPPPGLKDTGENLKELCSLEAEEPNKLQAAHGAVGGTLSSHSPAAFQLLLAFPNAYAQPEGRREVPVTACSLQGFRPERSHRFGRVNKRYPTKVHCWLHSLVSVAIFSKIGRDDVLGP